MASGLEVDPPINGERTVQAALEYLETLAAQGGNNAVVVDFTQSDLTVAGKLPVLPADPGEYYDVTVYSNTGEMVDPDNVFVSPTSFVVEMATYQPLNGTWHLRYRY